ncbi:hypothetical protein D3C87_86020 [compost metagenome]
MNIANIFFKELQEKELYSSEDFGGKFPLNVGSYVSKAAIASPQPILKSKLPFSSELRNNLVEFYSQVGELSTGWHLKEADIPRIRENDWLKKNFPGEEYSDSFLSETVSGVININSPAALQKDKIEINGNWYFPFDCHWNVMVCFKQENGVIEDNLYLFVVQDSRNITDMKIGCMEYLQLAYEAKLFYYWQYAYVFKDSLHNERLHKLLPEIFELVELDLSKFK